MASRKSIAKISTKWKVVFSIVLLIIVLISGVSVNDAIRQNRVSNSLDHVQQRLSASGFTSVERSGGCGRPEGKFGPGRLTCGQGITMTVITEDEQDTNKILSKLVAIVNDGDFRYTDNWQEQDIEVDPSGPSSVGSWGYEHKGTGATCTVSFSYQGDDALLSAWLDCRTPFWVTQIIP